SELVVKPDFQILRRYRRPLLLRLEHTHRPTLEDYVHRATRLGSSRSLNMRIGIKCSPHICAPTFLSLILWFAPKATANLKLIFETTTPLFHALGIGGGPIFIGTPRNGPDYHVYPDNANYARVWNTGHPSKNNMSMAVQLPWPNVLVVGQIMELLIDNVPKPVGEGRNRMWVVAE